MSRIARLALVALFACAFAALPATAGAAGTHGHRCGKGHTKHTRALGKACVKKHKGHAKRRDEAAPPAPITVPAAVVKACKDELAADPVAFATKYANAAGREALGRCIRINAEAGDSGDSGDSTTDTPPADKPPVDGTANAAQACAAEKAADPAAFQAKYADENGREAFGHCVRQAVQAGGDQSGSGDQGGDQGDEQGDQGDAPDQGDGTDQGDAPDQGDTPDGSGSGDGGDAVSGLDSLFF
jgi:hypothetical protein